MGVGRGWERTLRHSHRFLRNATPWEQYLRPSLLAEGLLGAHTGVFGSLES